MSRIVYQTELPLPLHHRGKVRDMYRCGDVLLMVATDRLSAFDVVFPTPIPDKGRVLTQLSAFWFRQLEAQGIAHHMLSVEWDTIADALRRAGVRNPEAYRETLEGRTMLIRPTKPYPVECVVRGYLAGSLWKEYCAVGGPESQSPVYLHGIPLPGGLVESAPLPEPIFTPATKATAGHDENISLEQAAAIVGEEAIRTLQVLSLKIYRFASEYARSRGILLADTKFEFGQDENGQILLIDEALTPDSSRFWDAGSYAPGGAQPSFDKQFVRDYVERLGWNKQPPAPELSDEIVEQTAMRYREAYRRLVGYAL